jgi:hypothetical protein
LNELQQPGNYRGLIRSYELHWTKNKALALSIVAGIEEWWSDENNEWVDCRDSEMETRGEIIILKTDGAVNDLQAKALVNYAAWDGNLESLSNAKWEPAPCAFRVDSNVWKNVETWRISFLNAYDSTPGIMGKVDSTEAKQLQMRFGASLKALAGNAARTQAPPPAGKPTALRPMGTPRRAGQPTYPDPNAVDPNAELQQEANE